MMKVGITISQLREGGFTGMELKESGVPVKELKAGGFKVDAMRSAGITAVELKQGGFTIKTQHPDVLESRAQRANASVPTPKGVVHYRRGVY